MNHPYQFTPYYPDHDLADELGSANYQQIGGAGHSGSGYDGEWISGDVAIMRFKHWQLLPALREATLALNVHLPQWKPIQVMANIMGPGSKLQAHRDGAMKIPDGFVAIYRFHLPVFTNPMVKWWDELVMHQWNMPMGWWYGPLPFMGVLHSMENRGDTARLHLIVDMAAPK